MVAGKKTPKPKLMMTYYDKLQRIFWVSDNKLFHAYACFRYYVLCCENRKDLKAEEKSIMASRYDVSIKCAMCCVLCAVCYVLCAMCYVLCAMCYVLCATNSRYK
jgi:hypothetical protein